MINDIEKRMNKYVTYFDNIFYNHSNIFILSENKIDYGIFLYSKYKVNKKTNNLLKIIEVLSIILNNNCVIRYIKDSPTEILDEGQIKTLKKMYNLKIISTLKKIGSGYDKIVYYELNNKNIIKYFNNQFSVLDKYNVILNLLLNKVCNFFEINNDNLTIHKNYLNRVFYPEAFNLYYQIKTQLLKR